MRSLLICLLALAPGLPAFTQDQPHSQHGFRYEMYLDTVYALLASILLVLALVYASVKIFGKRKQ